MHTNGLPVRYIGELTSPNYAPHAREFLSLRHAVETLRDLPLGCREDAIVLWRVSPHDSAGEAHSRTLDTGDAVYLLERGPRWGVKVSRV